MEMNVAVARILLVVVVFGLPVGIYVYRDAKKRGERWPAGWAIVSGLFVLAGLALYVLYREPARRE